MSGQVSRGSAGEYQAAARAFSLVVVRGRRIAVASPVAERRLSRVRGLQESRYVGLVTAVPGLWSTGLVAVVHGRTGSSQTRDLTPVSCLLHWQADSLPLSHQGSPFAIYFPLLLP